MPDAQNHSHVQAHAVTDPLKEWAPQGIDISKPSIARVYDALLGGKDNFAVDRAIADHFAQLLPEVQQAAWYERAVLGRGVRYLLEQGIRQFIDLGSGLPTARNTHQVAQEHSPDTRVVYIDNDPIVLAHSQALLAENPNTMVINADLRSPQEVLDHPRLRSLLDLDQPVGLMLLGVIHHLNDHENPDGVVQAYKDVLPSGGYMFLTHFVADGERTTGLEKMLLAELGTGRFRTIEKITSYFDGLELAEPGVVSNPLWRPDEPVPTPLTLTETLIAAGIGHKP
ncbi:SAM-dependent methyltransferase [Protofrankia symbiont of Coriaria ruscifolia]|uniref:SAM-dependent methyltransferase n=1 Tax=Candidatus Protofrankia californiensis TaxID=1839754 RepID=A0A1C3NY17_9ACTN|nr:SAM-dependent methyltransferase [Protofrankia symbiont of Coriaria ruscifolia]SBW22431.1 Protein of unknown function (DUF574) [Candidatus Protofrankia californiensis]